MGSRQILRSFSKRAFAVALLAAVFISPASAQTNWVLLGWNNLGMHCMDSDYSVFSILPPYNTVNAHLIRQVGTSTPELITVTNGLQVTYYAVGDTAGSSNRTSVGKSNFRQYAGALYGVTPAPDEGLAGYSMPGSNNVPQQMGFDSTWDWFVADGVPITPYDDTGMPNSYPVMRFAAETSGGTPLTGTTVVLPVSDEMDCRLCHHSGRGPAAEPVTGWVNDPDPGRDYRLNILLLHDQMQAGNPVYSSALTSNSLNAAGLYASVVQDDRPILCASCHLSEALPGTGIDGIPPLTEAIHDRHAPVEDPRNGMTLETNDNRVACYTCHPGSVTRCLRGAMGSAVAADGSMAMQCQSCHGSMSAVGSPTRTGWLDEPNCQSCHSGDAVLNEGSIRFLTSLTNGVLRPVSNDRFATNPDTPAVGHSLYRFSSGHGGLQCSACHGSTHAIYPSAAPNDNMQNAALQGQAGTLGDCMVCHGDTQQSEHTVRATDGPHGMHTIGDAWVAYHHDQVEDDTLGNCSVCHGEDLKGTVLSRALTDRALSVDLDAGSTTLRLWRGFQVSCYACHNGPYTGGATPNTAPTANAFAVATTSAIPVTVTLTGTDSDGPSTSYRVVSQPKNGTVAVAGSQATYHPGTGYSGTDTFTFARWDGFTDSNLATGTVTVAEIDSVGDDIPDWWRRLHFGGDGTTTNATSTALADPDGDDQNNLNEFRSGTDPNDEWSVVRFFAMSDDGQETTVRFASWLGQRFAIERSDDLLTENWTNIRNGVWGRTDSVTLTDPTPPGQEPRFYRTRQTHE